LEKFKFLIQKYDFVFQLEILSADARQVFPHHASGGHQRVSKRIYKIQFRYDFATFVFIEIILCTTKSTFFMFSQLPAAPAAALHAAYIVGSAPAAMVQPGDNL
jgi:hypothetical protein